MVLTPGDILEVVGGELGEGESESDLNLDYVPSLISGSGNDSNEEFYSSSSDDKDDPPPNLRHPYGHSSSRDDSDYYNAQDSDDDEYDLWGVRISEDDTTVRHIKREDV